jgi:hypothetical protein
VQNDEAFDAAGELFWRDRRFVAAQCRDRVTLFAQPRTARVTGFARGIGRRGQAARRGRRSAGVV